MYATRMTGHVRAPRAAVYRALLDPASLARWRAPDGMTARVHSLDPREGGAFRVSLSYPPSAGSGKSGPRTDSYRGRFLRLVPGEQVVEELTFETADPALGGTIRLTTTLTDAADGGTDVLMVHEGVPDAVPAADNEAGTRMALANLARLLEGGDG